MLEAWEKAEWSARETQLQALQEEQLQAFQAEVVAQDGKVNLPACTFHPHYGIMHDTPPPHLATPFIVLHYKTLTIRTAFLSKE